MNLILAVEYYISAVAEGREEQQLSALRVLEKALTGAVRGEENENDYHRLLRELGERHTDPLEFLDSVLKEVQAILNLKLGGGTASLGELCHTYQEIWSNRRKEPQ